MRRAHEVGRRHAQARGLCLQEPVGLDQQGPARSRAQAQHQHRHAGRAASTDPRLEADQCAADEMDRPDPCREGRQRRRDGRDRDRLRGHRDRGRLIATLGGKPHVSSPGIEFRIERPLAQAATTRADVAVFAGLVARRIRPLPDQLVLNLAEAGWREGGSFPVGDARLQALLGIPIAVESWDEFDALFDWNSRAPAAEAAERLACPLGLAVRQFFLNGGARAWIIRCGDPLPLTDANLDAGEFAKMQVKALAGPVEDGADCQPILPGWLGRSSNADPLDSATWQGAAAIFAIEDAAMLLLPDLPDLSAGPARRLEPVPEPPGPPEEFRPCASAAVELAPNARDARPGYRAPRLTKENYLFWSSALKHALELLGRPRGPEHRRDVMIVAALPIPDTLPGIQASPDRWPLDLLAER